MVKKNNMVLVKLAILSIALNEIAAGAVAPAMSKLIEAFPDYSPTTVQMIASMPSITMIVFSLLFSRVANSMKRRPFVFMALIIFIVGGVTPAFLTNLYAILFFRAIMGIGVAFIMPMAMLLINDFFRGKEKDQMIGWNVSAQMVGGTIFQMAGGYLANLHWSYTFLAYLFPLWILIFCFFFLPNPENTMPQQDAAVLAEGKSADRIPKTAWMFLVFYMLCHFGHYVVATNVSILIVDSGFGTPATVGGVLSVMTISSFVVGLIFQPIYKIVGRFTMALGTLFGMIGWLLCYTSKNLMMVNLGVVCGGAVMSLVIASFNARMTEIVPAGRMPNIMAYMVCAMGLGQFFQPIIYNAILASFGQTVGRSAFAVGATVMLIMTVILIIVNIKPYERLDIDAQSVAE